MKIRNILASRTTEVITIPPDELVREALALLVTHRIGALVVTNEAKQVVGIVSERDILWSLAEDEDVLSRPVREIMTSRVVVGLPQDDVMSVANTMLERRFRHLPIVEDDRLIGIVSIGDVLKTQRDAYEGEIETLETQILAEGE